MAGGRWADSCLGVEQARATGEAKDLAAQGVSSDKGDALRSELVTVTQGLNEDELAVLLAIAKRLAMGQKQYGPLAIKGDPRDFTHEAHEEFLDASVYLAIQTIRGAT